MTAAQNPDELFDIVTFLGDSTGVTKRRAEVHRDGDWHRAIHIWVVSKIDGVGAITFQRRSLSKDTLPGAFDATVGGHLAAGETVEDAFREAEEEIGVAITPDVAMFAGRRLGINERQSGVIDHEVQDVFFARDDRPLADYRPNPLELAGLVRVAIDDFLGLLAGELTSIDVEVLSSANRAVTLGTISPADFNRAADRYLYRVAIAARALLNGERHFSI
jgi:isopentenyldiphosphate isomerase